MTNYFKFSFMALAVAGIAGSAQAQTSTKKTAPNGWHLDDQATSGYYGISLDKAYQYVKGRPSKTVIVAVIDSGIDTLHEDLRPILWTNPKEIPGNGKDDDKNGYIDDVHGWNFIGGKDGRNVKKDSYEAARVYHAGKAKYSMVKDASSLPASEQAAYADWLRAKGDVADDVDPAATARIRTFLTKFKTGDSIIRKDLKKEVYNGNDLKTYEPTEKDAVAAKGLLMQISQGNNSYEISNEDILGELEGEVGKAEAADTPPPTYRADIVKDNEMDINDRYYGNNDIMASTPFHGTHVSGIIGAVRGNGKGIDGIADNVRIMTVRAVPDGDEHDKDIALAIRYAVDNGASIINMSFGKSFSPQKQWVDDAVKYAQSKGVLLVHAAGNDGKNLDEDYNFPNPDFIGGDTARTWMTIGASGDPTNGGLAARFSNYGQKQVDVFAPGVQIYSSVPGGNTYGNASGTSMASPVTAGVAAFLKEYFPTLTAAQLKEVIEKSSIKPTSTTKIPGGTDEVNYGILSVNGGIINAYEAAKMADEMAKKNPSNGKKVKVKEKKDKSKSKVKSF